MTKYKCWRSVKDKHIHIICGEGSEAFEALPAAIRNLGPWQGSKEGEVNALRLPLRVLLAEQAFALAQVHFLGPWQYPVRGQQAEVADRNNT